MKHILYLQARNFGDAVISTAFINSLGRSFNDYKIDVFTRPEFIPIFYNNPYINDIYTAQFPMGTKKNMSICNASKLFSKVRQLKKNKYDMCIDTTGDFREQVLGWVIRPDENVSVEWSDKHPFRQLVRPGISFFVDKYEYIGIETISIYDVYDNIALRMGCYIVAPPKIFPNQMLIEAYKKDNKKKIVAIHPFASQPCRQWVADKWRVLVHAIQQMGYVVRIFGASSEKVHLEKMFNGLLDEECISLHAGSLEQFFACLSLASVLISLDSFSVHAAYALNVPSIMLNGANDYRVWAPPSTKVISRSELCPSYPCYNRPKCRSSSDRYVCIRSITVEEVIQVIIDGKY